MPALSPTMTEGNLSKWLIKKGDTVKAGDLIAEIETDKATMEVEAVDEGVVLDLLFKEGEANIPVNKAIAIIGDPNEKIDIISLEEPMVQTGTIFDDGATYTNDQDGLFVYIYGLEHIPLQAGEIEIDHGGATGIVRYEISNVESTAAPTQAHGRDGTVYKINLSTGGNNDTSTTGLKTNLSDGTNVTIRANRSFVFDDLLEIALSDQAQRLCLMKAQQQLIDQ